MGIAARKSTYRLIDRACFALLELTRCNHLLVDHEHRDNREIQRDVDAFNIRLWDAKFSFFIVQYRLKKELQSLLSVLFNIEITPLTVHQAIVNHYNNLIAGPLFWIEPKKSNAP